MSGRAARELSRTRAITSPATALPDGALTSNRDRAKTGLHLTLVLQNMIGLQPFQRVGALSLRLHGGANTDGRPRSRWTHAGRVHPARTDRGGRLWGRLSRRAADARARRGGQGAARRARRRRV